jgi:hypothetical protein
MFPRVLRFDSQIGKMHTLTPGRKAQFLSREKREYAQPGSKPHTGKTYKLAEGRKVLQDPHQPGFPAKNGEYSKRQNLRKHITFIEDRQKIEGMPGIWQ